MSKTTNAAIDEVLDTVELTASERHRLLKEERRRLALFVLAGRTAPVELEEVTAQIVAREGGTAGPDNDDRRRVAHSLRYVHLPRLADAGVLDYDPEANLIEPPKSEAHQQ